MRLDPTILSDARSVAAYVIFFASYFVFALGKFPGLKIDRPGAAIIGAVLMVAFRIMTAQEALQAIDFPTIVLLFSMTLIVAHLHLGGFFEWVADATVLRLNARQLLAAVVFVSGALSAFLVNDVVCLVMTPFIVRVTRRLALEPLPYLLALATASNIGSVATITGNPQNMLIGSVSQIGYVDFLTHLGPVALVGLVIDWALLHWLYLRGVRPAAAPAPATPSAAIEHRPRLKPVIVLAIVLAGFMSGVPARFRCQHHRRRARPAGRAHRFSRVFPAGTAVDGAYALVGHPLAEPGPLGHATGGLRYPDRDLQQGAWRCGPLQGENS
jgi:Na+/H+ antiporter NhaD/arsenite permease-like protein